MPGKVHALTVHFHRPSLWAFALVQSKRAFSCLGGIDLRRNQRAT